MQRYEVKITGAKALLMHNGMLADPVHPQTREIKKALGVQSSKRSDEDWEALARAEFMGGLYLGSDGAPVVPVEALLKAIRDAATSVKRGFKTAVIASVQIEEGEVPLAYDGPKTADGLWAAKQPNGQPRFVDRRIVNLSPGSKNGGRGPRTRPRFDEWGATFTILVGEGFGVGEVELKKLLTNAGAIHGIGDGRGIGFGRFTADVTKIAG